MSVWMDLKIVTETVFRPMRILQEDRSFENDQSHYRYKVNPVSQPYEDRYDDLKTSSFYNEGYKKPGKGSLKGYWFPCSL